MLHAPTNSAFTFPSFLDDTSNSSLKIKEEFKGQIWVWRLFLLLFTVVAGVWGMSRAAFYHLCEQAVRMNSIQQIWTGSIGEKYPWPFIKKHQSKNLFQKIKNQSHKLKVEILDLRWETNNGKKENKERRIRKEVEEDFFW